MKKIVLIIAAAFISTALIAQNELFFSEYVEGSMQSKALEIYNPTNTTKSLDGYQIKRFSNGSNSPTSTLDIQLKEGPNEIGPYGTIVISNGQLEPNPDFGNAHVDTALYELADQNCSGTYPTPMYYNGNDALALVDPSGAPVDIFGKIGEDPGEGWCPIDSLDYQAGDYYWLSWTSNNRLVRKFEIVEGVTDPSIDYFNPAVEWDSIGWDTTHIDSNWSHLHYHKSAANPDDVGMQQNRKNNTENQIGLYPNPVYEGNQFTVFAKNPVQKVQIFNVTGKLIKQEALTEQKAIYTTNTQGLEKGIYLVRLTFDNKHQKTARLIVK